MMVESSSIVAVEELEQFTIDSVRCLGLKRLKDKQLEAILFFCPGQ